MGPSVCQVGARNRADEGKREESLRKYWHWLADMSGRAFTTRELDALAEEYILVAKRHPCVQRIWTGSSEPLSGNVVRLG